MVNLSGAAAAAATQEVRHHSLFRRGCRTIGRGCRAVGHSILFTLGRIPLYSYVFAAFVACAYTGVDLRMPYTIADGFVVTGVEALYLFAMGVIVLEFLRVSKPGVDSTPEATYILILSVTLLVLFALAVANVPELSIFRNTEFLVLTVLGLVQSVMAFRLNARTLKRAMEYNDSNHN